jgi:predicted DNA-binding transcriptional regulator AlpA
MTTRTASKLSRIIRAAELPAYVGLGKSKIYSMIAAGEFPGPIALTSSDKGVKGWLETELIEWQQQRAAAREVA